MTPNQRQEEISKAYLHAVAAKCGFAVGQWSQDHGCVDATVGAASKVGAGFLARPKIDVQLKATAQAGVEHDTFVSWSLDIDHYDALRAEASCPHLLVVLLLPNEVDEAVEHTVDHLLIRRCAFWVNMTGMAAAKAGAGSHTVRLPKSQVFSPDALRGILERVSQGVSP